MKFSEQWLREWVSPKLDTAGLAERFTLAGLEVAAVEPAAPPLKKIVVGRILSVAPHPGADRLRLCRVDVGQARPLNIVCGAANAAPGMKVPVARVGAVLADGRTLHKTEIRGEPSHGVLCSAAELGLEESSAGLLELGADTVIGESIEKALALDDRVIEVELTPNRGDCLSIAGLARELAALTGARLKPPRWRAAPVRSRRRLPVTLAAAGDCPRYAGRVIEGIDAGAPTPLWMRERLRRSGLRSLGPVVDVTNYVMLELGQPMHAFDLDKLKGGIRVQRARRPLELSLLDGATVEVPAGSLLIADQRGPLALAGIMGGSGSAVSGNTQNIFLESAFFAPEAIAGRARELGLQTESSHRFERGVDPGLQRRALDRATGLLLDIVGGRAGPVTEASRASALPKRPLVPLDHGRLQELAGVSLPARRVEQILKRLGMGLRAGARGWRVRPPGYRFDIAREVDLVEEVIRVHGYEQVPEAVPRVELSGPPEPAAARPARLQRLKHLLVDRGYHEIISYSFVDPALQALADPEARPLRLSNPISAEMAVMRTSLWPGLWQALSYNRNRQQSRMRFFEQGRCYHSLDPARGEVEMIAGAASGSALPRQWGAADRPVDFFDVKADVEALLDQAGYGEVRFRAARHPALHPGQSAEILAGGGRAGWLGALHPELVAKLELDAPVILFEIPVNPSINKELIRFQPASRFPAIRRDLALVVDIRTPVQQVMDLVGETAGRWLVDLQLFDDYRGEGIDSGRKSLALGLTFQDSSRTLKEEEIEMVLERVIGRLQAELGANPRS